MLLLDAPKITDWITALSALVGIPFAIWSFIKLVIKDADKQKQLKALTDLAETQNAINHQFKEQITQLSKQTSEFQYQSALMFDSNQILEKQVAIFQDYFQQRQSSELQKREIENQKRLFEIKPHFIFDGGGSNGESFELRLLNKGETAKNISLDTANSDYSNFKPLTDNLEIEKGGILRLTGWSISNQTSWNGNTVNFEITIRYSDIDGNYYSQRVARLSQQYIIDKPTIQS